MYDNAIICFTADHGDMLGDHYHWRKTYPYEGSTHIPYIVKWPAGVFKTVPSGAKIEQPVELRDFCLPLSSWQVEPFLPIWMANLC